MRKRLLYPAWLLAVLLTGLSPVLAQRRDTVTLQNAAIRLKWSHASDGYHLANLSVNRNGSWVSLGKPSGAYTILYSKEKPDTAKRTTFYDKNRKPIVFPEPQYRYLTGTWQESTSPVEMNVAGQSYEIYPSSVTEENGKLIFKGGNALFSLKAEWAADERFAGDIRVSIDIQVKKPGYYSIASPSLANCTGQPFQWATVPGVFQGDAINRQFINAFAYGQGLPDRPVVVRERTVSTLASILSLQQGISMAVVPEPGTGRDPWLKDQSTQSDWLVGLSHMNRKAQLMPTAYHPILGEKGSLQENGNTLHFAFRYILQPGDWYSVFRHTVEDIYRFNDFLALKETRRSLTDRILDMQQYVTQDSTSMWHVYDYDGVKIGAQSYLGGVHDSEKDALKNSDYGAMWMLGRISDDTVLKTTRLPYARNFKLMQQYRQDGFFKGAAAGQYYLYKSKKFTEEWGAYSEPVGTTYYMMMDIGNILLFEPEDKALVNELRLAAERLLGWMKPNGQWEVAYDNATRQPLFTDVEDLRPTFYGLMVAYDILKDERYLAAARKGADWYVEHAVNKGHFLGVCGDARFAPDFATGQSVQALLDLYDITKEEKYKDAALKAARIYTASIYTHPIPSRAMKTVKKEQRQDWEISQVGLSFEHGGTLGSANHAGPILLASHAGLFVRLFSLTGDSLFLNMARAAALGRDAFVDPATGVASYYWNAMNRGAGPFPHHAWWQIGWITDYLLSEVALRSQGKVVFPRGFITPKVGPHETYGFEPGIVFGNKAELMLKKGLLTLNSPYIDHFAAIDRKDKKLYLFLLNDDDEQRSFSVAIDYSKIPDLRAPKLSAVQAQGSFEPQPDQRGFASSVPAFGMQVICVDYE